MNHVAGTFHMFEQRDPERRHLLVVASGINFIDAAGAELLVQEARRRRKRGGGFYLVKAKEGLSESLRKGGYLEEFGAENSYNFV